MSKSSEAESVTPEALRDLLDADKARRQGDAFAARVRQNPEAQYAIAKRNELVDEDRRVLPDVARREAEELADKIAEPAVAAMPAAAAPANAPDAHPARVSKRITAHGAPAPDPRERATVPRLRIASGDAAGAISEQPTKSRGSALWVGVALFAGLAGVLLWWLTRSDATEPVAATVSASATNTQAGSPTTARASATSSTVEPSSATALPSPSASVTNSSSDAVSGSTRAATVGSSAQSPRSGSSASAPPSQVSSSSTTKTSPPPATSSSGLYYDEK